LTRLQKEEAKRKLERMDNNKKRTRESSHKLSIQFSRLGGPVGANKRIFVDDITMFTRKRAPLIRVRTWRDIDVDVKIAIANDVLVSFC
jgi:hypothetical protein